MHRLGAAAAGILDQQNPDAVRDRIAHRGGDAGIGPDAGHDQPFGVAAAQRRLERPFREGAGIVLAEQRLVAARRDLGADCGQGRVLVAEGGPPVGQHMLQRSRRHDTEVAAIGGVNDKQPPLPRRLQDFPRIRQHGLEALHHIVHVMPLLFLEVDQDERRAARIEGKRSPHQISRSSSSSSKGKTERSTGPCSLTSTSSSSFTPSRPSFSPM